MNAERVTASAPIPAHILVRETAAARFLDDISRAVSQWLKHHHQIDHVQDMKITMPENYRVEVSVINVDQGCIQEALQQAIDHVTR